jgi:SOS response regulatory protein OraA/RecX
VDAAERDAALERLEGVGYVDDRRVARSRAETLAARGQGDDAIRHDLEQRGLEADVIDDALAALGPETERAAALVARLGPTAKTAARLQRKGFSAESLEAALGDTIAAGGS